MRVSRPALTGPQWVPEGELTLPPMRKPHGLNLFIGLAAAALGAGLGCSGTPAPPAADAPPSPAPSAASPGPASGETTCPPRLADLPDGARLPALLVAAMGAAEGDKWVGFEADPPAGGESLGGWIAWQASGDVGLDLGKEPDALLRRLRSATGKEPKAVPPAPKSKTSSAEVQWGDGANRHSITLTGHAGLPGIEGNYACVATSAAKPLTLAEARALLPALIPEGLPDPMKELLAEKTIGSIDVRTGYATGGEARFEVVEGAAWKAEIEKRLAAAADSQLQFTVGGRPGVGYLSEEGRWKIDVYDLPAKKRIYVAASWEGSSVAEAARP